MVSVETKVVRYEAMLRAALDRAELVEDQKHSQELMIMARSYYKDGLYFQRTGDLINALICFSYGHGWLDAGIRIGALKVQ